jgi:hypothetical protein
MNKKVILGGIEIYSPVTDVSSENIFKFLSEIISGLEDELAEDDENLQFSMRTTFRVNTPAIIRFRSKGDAGSETMVKIISVINQITPEYVHQNRGTMEVTFDVQSVEDGFPVGIRITKPMDAGKFLSVNMRG